MKSTCGDPFLTPQRRGPLIRGHPSTGSREASSSRVFIDPGPPVEGPTWISGGPTSPARAPELRVHVWIWTVPWGP